MSIRIWAQLKDVPHPCTIGTLEQIRRDGRFITAVAFDGDSRPAHPIAEATAQDYLVRWFFENHPYSRAYAARMPKELSLVSRTSVGEALQWLEERVYCHFEDLALAGKPYLSGEPEDYAQAAAEYLNHVDDQQQGCALIWCTLLTLILATPMTGLPDTLQKALLARWKSSSTTAALPAHPEALQLHAAISGNAPLSARRITTPPGVSVSLPVSLPDGRQVTIRLRPDASLHACYAGDRLTCLKSAIAANGTQAAALVDGKLLWCSRGVITQLQSIDPGNLLDYTIDPNGVLYPLSGSRIHLPIDDERSLTLSKVVSVLMLDSIWVVLCQDGSTHSNTEELELTGIIAMTATDNDLLLLDRNGRVFTLSGATCSTDRFFDAMLRPFDHQSTDAAAESVCQASWQYIISKSNTFEAHPLSKGGHI